MRFKLTVLLLILNAAIICLILYIDKFQGSRKDFLDQSKIIIDPAFLQGVSDIEIENARSGERWHLRQTDSNQWEIAKPVSWKANPYAVQQLLFQLKTLAWFQRFPVASLDAAGQSLESYDLDNPPLTLHLQNGEDALALAFGAPTEIGNRLYLLSPSGDYILVISRSLAAALQQSLDQFLDRRLFGVGLEGSNVIQVQDRRASNVRVRMERDGRDWKFVSPIEAAADNERVEAMLADWQEMQGENFRTPQPEDVQFAGEGLRLTVEGLNARESIEFSEEVVESASGSTEVYLARMDGFEAIFEVPVDKVNPLRRVQEDLRERRILRRQAEDWSSMEIRFDDLSTTLQRLENGSWQVLHTQSDGQLVSQPADENIIASTRSILANLEAVRFVSDAPSETDLARYGLTEPQRNITLRKQDGTGITLSIGGLSMDSDESLLYGITDQQASVFLLRPHILSSIPLNPIHYRDRIISSIADTAETVAIELETLSDGSVETISAEQHAMEWARLQAYLRRIEVSRYVRSSFSIPLQLNSDQTLEWKYKLRGLFTYPEANTDGQQVQEVYLSERIGGTTQYIGDEESGLVGILPPDVIEVLEPMLIQFPEVPVPPDPLEPANPEGSGS